MVLRPDQLLGHVSRSNLFLDDNWNFFDGSLATIETKGSVSMGNSGCQRTEGQNRQTDAITHSIRANTSLRYQTPSSSPRRNRRHPVAHILVVYWHFHRHWGLQAHRFYQEDERLAVDNLPQPLYWSPSKLLLAAIKEFRAGSETTSGCNTREVCWKIYVVCPRSKQDVPAEVLEPRCTRCILLVYFKMGRTKLWINKGMRYQKKTHWDAPPSPITAAMLEIHSRGMNEQEG